ncbi:Hypothetical predicted protein, partial [Olea europaea subsp. europaea]
AHPNWKMTEFYKAGSSKVASSIHGVLRRQGFLLEGGIFPGMQEFHGRQGAYMGLTHSTLWQF